MRRRMASGFVVRENIPSHATRAGWNGRPARSTRRLAESIFAQRTRTVKLDENVQRPTSNGSPDFRYTLSESVPKV